MRIHDPWRDDDDADYDLQAEKQPESPRVASELPTYVNISVLDGRLPAEIRIEHAFTSSISPSNFGRHIVNAYHQALWQSASDDLAAGDFSRLRAVPSREVSHRALLRTQTPEEYDALSQIEAQFGLISTADDSVYDDNYPLAIITSKYFLITAIDLHPEWARQATASSIANEVMNCVELLADKLRAIREEQDGIRPLSNDKSPGQHRTELARKAGKR